MITALFKVKSIFQPHRLICFGKIVSSDKTETVLCVSNIDKEMNVCPFEHNYVFQTDNSV